MYHWQHWITLGNQAFSRHQQQLAQQYYRQALADVWPVWYHCAFVECPSELNADEAALPTHCLAVTLLNLAECYASQQRWRRCRRTLQQGLYWFSQMLQQGVTEHPAVLAVLMHQSKLLLAVQMMQQRQQLTLTAPPISTDVDHFAFPSAEVENQAESALNPRPYLH